MGNGTDPKTIRELKIFVDGVVNGINPQFGLLTKLLWSSIGFIGLLAAGGYTVYAVLSRDITEIRERLVKVEIATAEIAKSQSQVMSSQTQTLAVVSRIDARLATAPVTDPFAPIVLTGAEEQVVRAALSLKFTGFKPVFVKLGERAVWQSVKEVPTQLVENVPKLKGTRVAFDLDGSAVILTGDNRVAAIVAPQ